MPPIITIRDKETGELVDEVEVQAREHVTNYQAMISWRGIVKIGYGDSMSAAIQEVFDKFSRVPPVSQYDVSLAPGGN